MNVNELMIGNLVKSGNGIYKIAAMSVNGIEALELTGSDAVKGFIDASGVIIEPIPVTEEWQKKISNVQLYSFDHNDGSEPVYSFWFNSKIIFNVQYIHQLQNLIFVLRGEVLEINQQ